MAKQQQRKDTRFSSVEKRINTSMALDFCHRDIVNTVMGCRPVSSGLILLLLRAVPFNIRIVQAYAPTSDYGDNEIEKFYGQPQNVIDQPPKKDISVVQETGMQKWARTLVETGKALWTLLQ